VQRGNAVTDFSIDGNRLTVIGKLVEETEPGLKRALSDLMLSDSNVVEIDLREVDSISSICIGAVVAAWIDLHACERRLQVMPSKHVLRILDMAGITQAFEIVANPQ
jgi:anti-anti-sigma regulatory factor